MTTNNSLVVMVSLLAMASAAQASRTNLTPAQDAQVATLSGEIRVVAARVPAGSPESAYEAQFAALFANSQYSCTIVRDAIGRTAGSSRAAREALRNINQTLDTCGTGTAALPGGPASAAASPGFAIGGSDYRP